MPLINWRGEPVIPGAWLDGYRRLHPMMRVESRVGGNVQRSRAARLARWLDRLTDDGNAKW